jgi:AraC-like DNA-binding protein
VPDELFWFGKSIEQNFNESIWQTGFANFVTVERSMWGYQRPNYEDKPGRLVINLSDLDIPDAITLSKIAPKAGMSASEKMSAFAEMFNTFYGTTFDVGNALLARALIENGLSPENLDMSNLNTEGLSLCSHSFMCVSRLSR